ncbi:V-type ATPase 116kDa subunit family protein [Microcystis aeruginosa]|uniref:V-type ATPase 116kDa subunit family protein n=1 Tax=Microcystis aeruginosa TaxID=1126 RepID=UPI000306AB32|nr:V-type ATPase 116kDa subunit family protein [Microcystis aeruginosa]
MKIEQLEQHLKELQSSQEQLSEKVNRNSENSHCPPAADAALLVSVWKRGLY